MVAYASYRLDTLTTTGNVVLGFAEIQFRATAGSAASAPTPSSATAVSTYGSVPGNYDVTKTYDANAATFYSSNGSPAGDILVYNFAAAFTPVELMLQSRPDVNYSGAPISIRLSGSNDGGATWSVFPAITYATWAAASQVQTAAIGTAVALPTNTALPTISGTAAVGLTLTTTPGTWTGTGTITRQWNAAGTAIAGATALTYVPVAGDVGKVITVTETDTVAGNASTATSAATAAVIQSSGIVDGSTGVTPPTAHVAQASFSNSVGDNLSRDFSCVKNSTTGSAPLTYNLYVNGLQMPSDGGLADQLNAISISQFRAAAGYIAGMPTYTGSYALQVVCTDPNVSPASTFARTVTMTTAAQPAVPGLVKLKNFSFEYHAFYVQSAALAQCKSDGFTTIAGGQFDHDDGESGVGAVNVANGKQWAVNVGNAGLKYTVMPGFSSSNTYNPDYTDDRTGIDYALQDPNCVGFNLQDEVLTQDFNPTSFTQAAIRDVNGKAEPGGAPFIYRQAAVDMTAFYVAAKARATALAVPMKQTYMNQGEYVVPGDNQRAILNATTGVVGSDKYFADAQISRLIGTTFNGQAFMGTREMHSIYMATVVPNYRTQLREGTHDQISTAPVQSLGSGFLPYIQFSTFTKFTVDGVTPAKLPTPAENWSIMVSVLHIGNCVAIGGFMVHFTSTTNGVTDPYVQYAFNPYYKPTLTRHKALTALLQSRGKLMSASGDRTAVDFYPSPPSLDTGSIIADSNMTFQDVGSVAVPAGTTGWGVGGFALSKLWNDGKTAHDKLLTNLTKDTLTITNFTAFGITSMTFAPLESKLFDGTDTAFATNLMPALAAGSGWAARGGFALTPINNLLPSVVGQPRTMSGRSITAGEVAANSDASGLNYAATLPAQGNGSTGGVSVTLTEPVSGGSPRVTVLTATITA